MQPRNTRLNLAVLGLAVVASSVTTSMLSTHYGTDLISHSHAAGAPATVVPSAVPGAPAVPMNQRGLPDFSVLVDQQGPAVVNISTVQKVRTSAQAMPGMPSQPGDPFFEFFRRFGQPGQPGRPQAPEGRASGVGSGFIISSDGYVLTNAHVVANATEVTVKLTDRREFKAKVVGADRRTDVALLKVDAKNLPAVRIGNPENLRTGEWVAAIGSPFGLENTVTAGIVSAKARSLPSENYVPFIQTDVAINPGNSGGPLFNLSGEVVGINSQIYSQSGGYMGLSFSIPIDVAMRVTDQLQKFGKASHGRIGVVIQPVTRDLADSFGMAKATGALVSSVEADGPAAKAGVQPGDVVLAVNGKEVDQSNELPRIVGEMRPGTRATFKVWRQGATRDISISLGELQQDKLASADVPAAAPDGGKLGLAVRPLSPEEKKQLGSDGLLVEQASGAAAEAGIQNGDVILNVNGERVSSVEQLRKFSNRTKGKVAVLVQRADARIYIPITIG
jgi:serine protease Do